MEKSKKQKIHEAIQSLERGLEGIDKKDFIEYIEVLREMAVKAKKDGEYSQLSAYDKRLKILNFLVMWQRE